MTNTEKIKLSDLQYMLYKQVQHKDVLLDRLENYRKCMQFYLSNGRIREFESMVSKYLDDKHDLEFTYSAIIRLGMNIEILKKNEEERTRYNGKVGK